jgi:hypothetical protein
MEMEQLFEEVLREAKVVDSEKILAVLKKAKEYLILFSQSNCTTAEDSFFEKQIDLVNQILHNFEKREDWILSCFDKPGGDLRKLPRRA